jgi:putative nucleotidyltransferase with HDIG domain
MLGLDRARDLSTVEAMSGYARLAPHHAELQRCWRHSLATAILATEIANRCGRSSKLVFTAGILHDIGHLGLLVAYPNRYTDYMTSGQVNYVDMLDFERTEFGIEHTEAGRLLAESWGLPDDILMVVGRHHDPCEGEELSPLRLIHCACELANVLGFALLPPSPDADVDWALGILPAASRARLRMQADELRDLVDRQMAKFL